MNADLKNSKFLSFQARVNKELVSNLAHAAYKVEGEAIKNRSFLTF